MSDTATQEITVILEHRSGSVDWPTLAVFEKKEDAEVVCRWLNATQTKGPGQAEHFYVRSKPFLPTNDE